MGIFNILRKGSGKTKEVLAEAAKKPRSKPQSVEVSQSKIRKKAKKAGQSVKTFRQKNPNDKDVKALYAQKPKIKDADKVRAQNRASDARNRETNNELKKHDRIAKKYAKAEGVEKIPQKRLDDYAKYQMEHPNAIEGMYKLKDSKGNFTGEFRDVSTGKVNTIDGSNKGGMIPRPRPRTGAMDMRKGGMVISTVDNRKNKG
tara:strand:+ start:21 stop:626 length:606 start_codon:yes stop_codon:yes gene_type:complete